MDCSNNVKGIGVKAQLTRLSGCVSEVTEPVENPLPPPRSLLVFLLSSSIFFLFSPAAGPIDSSPLASKDFRANFHRQSDEACSKAFLPAGGHLCTLDRPLAGIHSTTKPYLVAANLFYCVTWMLWFINGRSRSNAFPYLPSRSIAAAAGYRRSQGLSEAKGG
ncbi:hypothetical protein GQ457_05G003900 [Hibiscus cannabinus]